MSKFFSGLTDNMMNRERKPDRQKSNFFWPEEEAEANVVKSTRGSRYSPDAKPQIPANGVVNNAPKSAQTSKHDFYDTVDEPNPISRRINKNLKQQDNEKIIKVPSNHALKSNVEFFDNIEDEKMSKPKQKNFDVDPNHKNKKFVNPTDVEFGFQNKSSNSGGQVKLNNGSNITENKSKTTHMSSEYNTNKTNSSRSYFDVIQDDIHHQFHENLKISGEHENNRQQQHNRKLQFNGDNVDTHHQKESHIDLNHHPRAPQENSSSVTTQSSNYHRSHYEHNDGGNVTRSNETSSHSARYDNEDPASTPAQQRIVPPAPLSEARMRAHSQLKSSIFF